MTKEEYLQLTSYPSLQEAQKDLSMIQVLFPLTLGLMLVGQPITRLALLMHPAMEAIIFIGYSIFGIFFVWKCRDILVKTRKVAKGELLFSILFAPLSWIWFYPQLSEPLEIIVGKRMPPTTDVATETQARIDAAKKGSRNATRTILIVTGITLLAALVIGFLQKPA